MTGFPDDAHAPQLSIVYDENGVDRTLIRASLRETPLECLEALEAMQELAESVRRVGEQIPTAD